MKLIKTDYMIIVAIFMFLGAHLCTNFLIAHYQSAAVSIGAAQELAYEFEGNPIAKFMFQMQGVNLMYTYAVMPALIVGLYYTIRRTFKEQPEMVMVFVLAIVVMAISNFLNDFSIFLGVVSR